MSVRFLHARVYIPSTRIKNTHMRYVIILSHVREVYSIYTYQELQWCVMSHSYMRVCIFHLHVSRTQSYVLCHILHAACVYSMLSRWMQEHNMCYVTFLHAREVYSRLHISRTQYALCHILTCACVYSIYTYQEAQYDVTVTFLHARVYIPSTRIKNTYALCHILTCACVYSIYTYQEHNMCYVTFLHARVYIPSIRIKNTIMRYVTFLHVRVPYSIYTYQEHNMRYVTFLHVHVYIPSIRIKNTICVMSHSYMRVCIFHLHVSRTQYALCHILTWRVCIFHLHVSRTQYALCHILTCACVYSIYTYQEHNMCYVTFLHARVYIPSTRIQEHNMCYVTFLHVHVYIPSTCIKNTICVMSHSYMRVCIFLSLQRLNGYTVNRPFKRLHGSFFRFG